MQNERRSRSQFCVFVVLKCTSPGYKLWQNCDIRWIKCCFGYKNEHDTWPHHCYSPLTVKVKSRLCVYHTLTNWLGKAKSFTKRINCSLLDCNVIYPNASKLIDALQYKALNHWPTFDMDVITLNCIKLKVCTLNWYTLFNNNIYSSSI